MCPCAQRVATEDKVCQGSLYLPFTVCMRWLRANVCRLLANQFKGIHTLLSLHHNFIEIRFRWTESALLTHEIKEKPTQTK